MSINWFKYAAPQRFYPLAGCAVPWLSAAAALLGLAGLAIGLLIAPTDHQQGDSYRIIFVHVPAAWMSMVIYLAMAFWAAIGLILNARLASMMAIALAPTGAWMTFIALWTGALWGKPTWGTWWVWDARLTSELILLFLYIGFMSLHAAIDDERRADRAAAVLALVGLSKSPSMASTMLLGMLVMALAFWMYSIAVSLMRVRVILLEREQHTDWARQAMMDAGAAA
jgi:heme exporter protein C